MVTALLLGFLTLLLIDPQSVIASGKKAVNLCINIIIPSLLPFFVISRLILKTGAIHPISRFFRPVMRPLFNLPAQAAFPLVAGWLSGYPAGAKYTTDLYEGNFLSKKEAQRLLAFCNNASPLFIVGAIGTGYFNSPGLGLILFFSHLSASISVGIVTGLLSRIKRSAQMEEEKLSERYQMNTSIHMLTEAIMDSMKVLLQISGTIIFFAVLVQTLEIAGIFTALSRMIIRILPGNEAFVEMIEIFIAGSLELTYGLYLLSLSTPVPVFLKILMTAFLCGFGGFSVHTQVTGLCPGDFNLREFFTGKLAHGAIAAVYTGLFLANTSIPVMTNTPALYDMRPTKILLCIYILILLTGIICLVGQQANRIKNR